MVRLSAARRSPSSGVVTVRWRHVELAPDPDPFSPPSFPCSRPNPPLPSSRTAGGRRASPDREELRSAAGRTLGGGSAASDPPGASVASAPAGKPCRPASPGSAFGWYTSLPPNSVRTWKQLEEQFHVQYHSEATEAGIADLTQVRQKRGETVSEYIQRFRTVRNRCYSVRLTEKEAVELAALGLATPIKDLAFQAEYSSLAHMVQKLTSYEQRHPELYQDKFKRPVGLVETEEAEDSAGDLEVAVAEWARGAAPVSCKWVKPQGPAKGFDFDVSKADI
ncbi:hypothetical protein QYE76_034294 [Lolium multiflorum]|uniref:Retrotransposon gag domain-containing protein n=1 Tax=Lolium multiflorum TaxID=4521 RepID=A0AAD8QXF6_LOLMU|nr:hypothetical protein QYE76_034294 [Lolium multiflorum]